MNVIDESLLADYQALTVGAGLADFSHRTLVEMTGDDRSRFLHNLCTNEIRKLAAGAGCEAFLTNVQGKILAHVLVFSGPDSLVLETVPGQADKILAHLDRYLIREKVELRNRSLDWSEWLLAGSQSEPLLAGAFAGGLPGQLLSSSSGEIAGREVWLRRVDLVGPVGFLIDCRRSDFAEVGEALCSAGARPVSAAAVEMARIEAGWPQFAADITEKNLPQEIARDDRAISFTKGCYLGQETVARIDALGHVNRTLVGVRFAGAQVPILGLEMFAGENAVGEVTSACYSPRLAAPLALAYVRRGSNQPAARLESAAGAGEVVGLPVD
jgi:tRNA-modifying protein YgfZ